MTPGWSIVIPYYNEASFLPRTLASIVSQTERPRELILVDNGSTDGSAAIAKEYMTAYPDIVTRLLDEPRPGQVNALEAGISAVTTEFVAVCDADTWYPPHHLALAGSQFERAGHDVVAMMSLGLSGDPHGPRAIARRWLYAHVISRLLRYQCHTGGYGHAFRTAALRAAGGYTTEHWSFVLFDHELMHRIFAQGRARYHADLWCVSSNRRKDRANTRWSLTERIVYHATPFALKDWFFYSFLRQRFAARNLSGLNLRDERGWDSATPA